LFPLYDTVPTRKRPYVIYALLAVNIAVFLYEQSLNRVDLLQFMYNFGLVPARWTVQGWERFWQIRTGLQLHASRWWSLFTHMFLHGGWSHIIGNMWFLWVFGDNVEDKMGHVKFSIFYLSSGVAAALAYFPFGFRSQIPMVGASGAISAVMGAYYVMFPYSRIVSFVPIFFFFTLAAIPAGAYLLLWFLFQILSGVLDSAMSTGVAWWAHVSGFLLGVLWGRYERRKLYYF